jgi:hypothetical protein
MLQMTRKASLAIIALAALILCVPGLAQATAISFSTTGVFDNAAPEDAAAWGEGSNYFLWGYPFTHDNAKSSLKFEGRSVSADVGEDFVLGALWYHNGTIVSGTGASSVDLDITFSSLVTIPDLTLALDLDNTYNDPHDHSKWPDSVAIASGDSTLQTIPFAYDGESYVLTILGFDYGHLVGTHYSSCCGSHNKSCCYGSFTSSEIVLAEECTGKVKIVGRIDEVEQPIPEPGTMLLLGSGLLGMAWRRRRG